MKVKNIVFLAVLITVSSKSFAQYEADVLHFSQSEQGSSSRFKGLGNAQTALGGDVSSLASNPAGLGLFTRSEFNLTSDFNMSDIKSEYLNQSSDSQKNRLGLNQAGAVFYSPLLRYKGNDLQTGWLSINYGIAYNKTNNFNSTIDYSGQNPKSSIADYISDIASSNLNAGDPSVNTNALPKGSLQRMAYNNYLIQYDPSGYFPTTSLNNNQRNIVYHTGSQSEINFGIGANYSNQLYVGVSLGLASLDYNSSRTFIESGNNRTYSGQPADFINGTYKLTYSSDQLTKGSGLNAKLGLIYRATNSIRLGFNFITPTWYHVADSFSEALDTHYNKENGSAITPPYTNDPELYDSEYDLRTPYHVNGGIAVIIGNQGLISGDVEYVDYSSINFSSSDKIASKNMTNYIRDNYRDAVNFRLGGEYKIDKISLRAGYNSSGTPFKGSNYLTQISSAGIGYRSNIFYLDVTYQNISSQSSNTPYTISKDYADFATTGAGEAALLKDTRNNVSLTIGARF